jgi:hypothetical protein
MKTNSNITGHLDTKALLSSLWVVVAIHILMPDILALYIPGTADELVKFAGDTPIARPLLSGAVMIEISILMIVFSRVLQWRVSSRLPSSLATDQAPRIPCSSQRWK